MAEIKKKREREPERRRKRKKISPMKLKEMYGEKLKIEEGYELPAVEVIGEEDFLLPEEEAALEQERELEKEKTKERIRAKILQKQQDIEKKADDINKKIKKLWQDSLSKFVNTIINYMSWPMYQEERIALFKRLYTYLDYIAGSVISDREDNRETLHIHIIQQYFDQSELGGIISEIIEVPESQIDLMASTMYSNLDSETEKLEQIVDDGIEEYQIYLDNKFARKPRPKNTWKAILQRKTEFASKKIRELDTNAYLRAIHAKMIRPAAVVRGFEPPEKIEHGEEVYLAEAIEHPELESIDEDLENITLDIAQLEEMGYSEGFLSDDDINELDDLYATLEELEDSRQDKINDLIQRGYA
jgi:hypothetical protein